MNAAACRFPRVMVPVLSSSSTSTSPAASTARPDVAMTLDAIIRLMPATPMADSRPPMVVGMRQTCKATSTEIVTVPQLRRRRRNPLRWILCPRQLLGAAGLLKAARGGGLGFAPPLRQGFGEVREQHGEPQPRRYGKNEAGRRLALATQRLHEQ